jgi:hypothetical protein
VTPSDTLAQLCRALAEHDFRGASPLYETLALGLADDPDVLSLLSPAAPRDRMPHLLLAAVQYLLVRDGVGMLEAFAAQPYLSFRSFCLEHRSELEHLTATRVNQTNEVGRCAALAPALGVVGRLAGQPLALVEVGPSAGLNLMFDRYRYDFGLGAQAGPTDSVVVVRPRLVGPLTPPSVLPDVAWRVGLDRKPVDVRDDDAVAWLRACIWPEQQWRRELFDQAVATARLEPPRLMTGDAVANLADVIESVPGDTPLCVFHTAVIGYLPDARRFAETLADAASQRPIWWLPGEPAGFVPELTSSATFAPAGIVFRFGVVPLGMEAGWSPRTLAHTGSHGAWLEWMDPDTAG